MQTHDFFTKIITTNCLGPNMDVPADKGGDCVVLYACQGCGEEHEAECDAQSCCKPTEIYRCSACNEKHADEGEADECCQSTKGGQPRQCPVCMKPAETFVGAADCCLFNHPTMTAYGRQRVAEAVERGTPWPEAVAANVSH